jgi:hypothetical protein
MDATVGLAFMTISAISYMIGLNLVSYFYHRSFSSAKPRESLRQVAQRYTANVGWCIREGTMPKWVPKIVSWSVHGFIFGALWCLIAIFI